MLFLDDTFWPIIIGHTGVIVVGVYVLLLVKIFLATIKVKVFNMHMYATALFIFAYLGISSTSELAFNNAIAIPLAMLLGYILANLKILKITIGVFLVAYIGYMEHRALNNHYI